MSHKMIVVALLLSSVGVGSYLTAASEKPEDLQTAAMKDYKAGNYRDALDKFRTLLTQITPRSMDDANNLSHAIRCLHRLNLVHEFDEIVEAAVAEHSDDSALLLEAALSYKNAPHFGRLISNEFERGHHRGGGKYVSTEARDRVRALQLIELAANPFNNSPSDKGHFADIHLHWAEILQQGRHGTEAWRLQVLTDVTKLPDYEEGHEYGFGRFGGGQAEGAPVDEEGNPIFYAMPASYKEAKSDGERWRFVLHRMVQEDASRVDLAKAKWANFLYEQFGVQTMQYYPLMAQLQNGDDESAEDGPYAVHTLKDNETIARLATGIKRFELPEEYNFIRLFRELTESKGKTTRGSAMDTLSRIYENRRQYPEAAKWIKDAIATVGPGHNDRRKKRLQQIVGNWGQFEPTRVQSAGSGATVSFRYRNAQQADFEVHQIDMQQLLADIQLYLKSNPAKLDYNKVNFENVGHLLVGLNERKYIGKRVANWSEQLKPRPNHFDRRMTVTTPMKDPGVYLLKAKLTDGNISRVIIWVNDTMIVKKRLNGRMLYFVADAETGAPIPNAKLDFFGYQQKRLGRNKYDVSVRQFVEKVDENGQVSPDPSLLTPDQFSWMVTARTDAGRVAYLGFQGVWYGRRYRESSYDRNLLYAITDRPVYRPDQTVKFKLWIRNARYDKPEDSKFAHQKFTLRINDPQGKEILKKEFEADDFGGYAGELPLAADATLGQYSIGLVDARGVSGQGTFRVEEYKKPEFEVTVETADEPAMLGEKLTATVNAKYYFGAPVTEAKVSYRVMRYAYNKQWYPKGRWDWFYDPGYWWFSPDYEWYPGWRKWGCVAPVFSWWYQPTPPPELVEQKEVAIGADGTVKIEIDTTLAKELHSNTDHRYEITAEVVDQSRRTIVGKGEVLVAREPFEVFAWVDRGYYQVGDEIRAQFKGQTLNQKPVAGVGELTLYRVTYDAEGKPTETVAQTWELNTDKEGTAEQRMTASQPGQYRLSYKLTDAKEHTIEGGYLFTVRGEGFNGEQFRFNNLELITDKKEYQPGETVRLMVNTNRVGGHVLLFLRPVDGTYLPPQLIKMDGKSSVYEIAVADQDMPNFFVEAFTISSGKTYTAVREVIVPPQKRVLDVEVVSGSEKYRPGSAADLKIKLTDIDGKPFVGTTVVSVYDKSVEYISGGSNVAEIMSYFWKSRRHHHPQTETNFDRYFMNLLEKGETTLQAIGAFGNLLEPLAIDEAEGMGGGAAFGARMKDRSGPQPAMAPMSGLRSNQTSAPMMSKSKEVSEEMSDASGAAPGGGDGPAEATPTIRSKFADTAFWSANVTTDENGLATVNFDWPDDLTTWKVRTWALGHGTRVGQGESEVITSKNIIVRLQAPRFFLEKDEVVLSANVHNYLETEQSVRVVLEMDGEFLTTGETLEKMVTVAADGEQRVDWRVKVAQPGQVTLRVKALTAEESDAVEMKFPVRVHGVLKTESYAGSVKPNEQSQRIEIHVPSARKPEQSRVEVRYSPSLAAALVDALPYLVSYPHKTTDTTLNRFLPTVLTHRILQSMDLDLKKIRDKQANLNAQEIGDPQKRAEGWKRFDHNPVFDNDEVNLLVKQGLVALYEMQLSDGGWGWFSGWGERSSAHTTAQVVRGMLVAQKNGVEIVPQVLERGVAWLNDYQAAELQKLKNGDVEFGEKKKKPYKTSADNLDALVLMVLADAGQFNKEMSEYVYRHRKSLSVYSLAMYGLTLHQAGDQEKLSMVLRNIDQFLVQDEENETAYLDIAGGYWWYWYGSETEANAYYLKLLSRVDPKGEKASRLVKYLLNNRKHATYWSSTRDTALAVEALAEYVVASGQNNPDMKVALYYDGQKKQEVHITKENLFDFENAFVLSGAEVADGSHLIELRKEGAGRLYYNAYVTNFTQEDFISAAGLEVKVRRNYYKLIPKEATADVAGSRGQAINQAVHKYERVELHSGDELESGQLVEVELELESKNDYEYLIFQDSKPAGFEPVDLRSGYVYGGLHAYVQFRDIGTTFFLRRLARGKHNVSYRLRAEIPGRFNALPALAEGMYAPELRGNSDEMRVEIKDVSISEVKEAAGSK